VIKADVDWDASWTQQNLSTINDIAQAVGSSSSSYD
jgi:hypothetical protein